VTDERKIALAVVGTALLVIGAIFLSEPVQRELRPDPVRAFVAMQAAGEEFAHQGQLELAAGAEFRLHAVLEAVTRGGERVFFTEAPALLVDGEPVAVEALRRWRGPEEVKILWFSVEGPRPFVEIDEPGHLADFEFHQSFRPDWPRAWSIPGDLKPARRVEASLAGGYAIDFGTQRYQVRIELFGASSQLVPRASFDSIGPNELLASPATFPTASAVLDGVLALPSRVFGLSQIDLGAEALESDAETLQGWQQQDLAFSRLGLLRSVLERTETTWEDLHWTAVDLAAGPAWAAGAVARGHLLRVGDRVVFLLADRGEIGRLDYDDLVLDFSEGAEIRALGEIFSGEGLVDWAVVGGE